MRQSRTRHTKARTHDIVSRTTPSGHAGRPAERIFSSLPVRPRAEWTPQRLAWTSVLAAWDDAPTLAARFEHACSVGRELHPHWKLGASYSGFVEALARESSVLAEALKRRFRRVMRAEAGERWTRGAWCVFAVDGSRLEAPRTPANEQGLGRAGREKTGPQAFLTVMWHLGLGLPWDYRVGPGTSSERTHARDMLDDLPPNSLLVADAGFPGFPLCRAIHDSHRTFLLRVGGNVHLLTDLGYYERDDEEGVVYLWPNSQRDFPPLKLRLITLVRGKQRVFLVTNELDSKRLSDVEAAELYAARWGTETFFRSYKQTLDRRKLLGRTPRTCLAEAEATLWGVWLLGLMSVKEILRAKRDPLRWSVAPSRDAVRRAIRGETARRRRRSRRSRIVAKHRKSARVPRGTDLHDLLAAALIDDYVRRGSKTTRDYPRKKREKPPSPPKIRPATTQEVQRAATFPPPEAPSSWTA